MNTPSVARDSNFMTCIDVFDQHAKQTSYDWMHFPEFWKAISNLTDMQLTYMSNLHLANLPIFWHKRMDASEVEVIEVIVRDLIDTSRFDEVRWVMDKLRQPNESPSRTTKHYVDNLVNLETMTFQGIVSDKRLTEYRWISTSVHTYNGWMKP